MTFAVDNPTAEAIGHVLAKLAELQQLDNPDRVAAHLESRGTQGLPMNPDDCPVHRYIATDAASYPDLARVTVGARSVSIEFRSGGCLHYDTPPVVAEFIRRFDTRAYPNLIEAPGPGRASTPDKRTP